jgi:hypothetical protein
MGPVVFHARPLFPNDVVNLRSGVRIDRIYRAIAIVGSGASVSLADADLDRLALPRFPTSRHQLFASVRYLTTNGLDGFQT